MANKFWIDEAAEKGRIVRKGYYTFHKGVFNDADIVKVFGWGTQESIWANPCKLSGLDAFIGKAPNELTERMGFLFWNAAATQRHDVQKVKLVRDNTEVEFYSVCGYKQLMPHMHNFSNSSKAIKKLEDQLIDELTFHLFASKGKSTRGLGGRPKMDVTGYTIRFSELPITPKDNDTDEMFETEQTRTTNRVGRGRIYGAILIPTVIIDGIFETLKYAGGKKKGQEIKDAKTKQPIEVQVAGAKTAYPWEIIYDPKRDIPPAHTQPPPTTPPPPLEFTEEQLAELEALSLPVGQYDLGPEGTREQQIKQWKGTAEELISALKQDPNLYVVDPTNYLAAKLIEYKERSPAKSDNILKALQHKSYSDIFVEYKDEKFNAADATVFDQESADRTYYVSIITNIDHSLHPDPEFLYLSKEHDEAIISAVRTIFAGAKNQVEIIQEYTKVDDDHLEDNKLVSYGNRIREGPLYYWSKKNRQFEAGPMTDESIEAEKEILKKEGVIWPTTAKPANSFTPSANEIYGAPGKPNPEVLALAGKPWKEKRGDKTRRFDVVQKGHVVSKFPPHRNLFEIAADKNIGSIGYWKVTSIPEATHQKGIDVDSWIITVGISHKAIEAADDADYSDPTISHRPPVNLFDWIPRVGMTPWQTRHFKAAKDGDVKESDATLEIDRHYYVYLSDHEYFSVKYDSERRHNVRHEAVFELYQSLQQPLIPDYNVVDFRIAAMPFTSRAVVLVAINTEWITNQPPIKGTEYKTVPPVVEPPKLAFGARPFVNWMQTSPPFPIWHDADRESYYSIIEAEFANEFMDDEGKISLTKAENVLGERIFHDVCKFYGKTAAINPRVSESAYFNYWKSRALPLVKTDVWLHPRPLSLPRVVVSIEENLLNNLPDLPRVVSWNDAESYSRAFENDELLILKIPTTDIVGQFGFSRRMQVASQSLRKQANKLGKKKRSSQGLTAKELRSAARHVSRFFDQFVSMVVQRNHINVDIGGEAAIKNLEQENACEYYLYLDPKDFSVKEAFAFGYTRMERGLSAFKSVWRPPYNKGMQFVFWAGMTYVKTNHGRQSNDFSFSDFMNILTDPFGALGDWMSGFPDVPGLPPGFIGQTLKNATDEIKQIPPKPPSGYFTAEEEEVAEKRKKHIDKEAAKIAEKRGFYQMNPDTYNPAAVHEDPNWALDAMSNAGCGSELFKGILSKVNLLSLIMMYLKCLGIKLPIDPRCLFGLPFPFFDFNIMIPKIMIPWPISWADIWRIILKILFQILCALIIELLMQLIKMILEAVLNLPGCGDGQGGDPILPGADEDFGPLDPKDMIEDGLAFEELDPLAPPHPMSPLDGAANDTFAKCQPGLLESDYSGWRESGSALTYLKDVSEILTGVEFCALLRGEASLDILERVIRYTKEYYPRLYGKTEGVKIPDAPDYKPYESEPTSLAAHKPMPYAAKPVMSATGETITRTVTTTTTAESTAPITDKEGSYIGWPRPHADPYHYRNFFLCLAAFYQHWIKKNCNMDEWAKRYPLPVGDDKCLPPGFANNDRIRDIWKGRGLNDAEISDLIEKADNEILGKLTEMDAIQAAVDDFLAVTVPKVTAPVVDAVLMNAFDSIFKGIVAQMRSAVERISKDLWEADDDLQLMVNYVVNARNVTIKGPFSWSYRRCWGWWWDRHCRRYYYTWWFLPWWGGTNTDWSIPADQIFLHD